MGRLQKMGAPLLIACLTLVLIAAGVIISRQQQPAPLVIAEPTRTQLSTPVDIAATPTAEKTVKVYVSGAVVKPDVYALKASDRVKEAIEAAGGATPDADLEQINLAARLRDEMQIRVPHKGEAVASPVTGNTSEPSTPSSNTNMKLNINTASSAQLEALPGIGTVTAGKIIAYRDQHGPFKTVEQLKNEKLVTNATYEKIKDMITVE